MEDAAQAINSFYKGKALGSFGHLAAFSFHETKNIISGEGGMLVINDEKFINRAEIVREKGTNRTQFFRGETKQYDWVDIGSSFLPSDIIAAFLYAQLENIEKIQKKRMSIWTFYYDGLKSLEKLKKVSLPKIPNYATNNAHIFYLICNSEKERTKLIEHLKADGILAVFHYVSLHKSPYYKGFNEDKELVQADFYTNCLLRLPMFYDLTAKQQNQVINSIVRFYSS